MVLTCTLKHEGYRTLLRPTIMVLCFLGILTCRASRRCRCWMLIRCTWRMFSSVFFMQPLSTSQKLRLLDLSLSRYCGSKLCGNTVESALLCDFSYIPLTVYICFMTTSRLPLMRTTTSLKLRLLWPSFVTKSSSQSTYLQRRLVW